jgi:hypothetical protein
MKTLPNNRIVCELGVKDFHRDSATEHKVTGFPHLGHSADGQLRMQLVALREDSSCERATSLMCGW